MNIIINDKFGIILNDNIAFVQYNSCSFQIEFDEIFRHENRWIVFRQNKLYMVLIHKMIIFYSENKIIEFKTCKLFGYPYGIDDHGINYLLIMKIKVKCSNYYGSPYEYHLRHGSMIYELENVPDGFPNLKDFQLHIKKGEYRNTRLYYSASPERQYYEAFGRNNQIVTLEKFMKVRDEFGIFMGFGNMQMKCLSPPSCNHVLFR